MTKCKWCGKEIPYHDTNECDSCWELHFRIRKYPKIAENMLATCERKPVYNTTSNRICKVCGETIVVEYDIEDFHKWKKGMVIQKALPYLSDDERELFISGMCRKCFDRLYDPKV